MSDRLPGRSLTGRGRRWIGLAVVAVAGLAASIVAAVIASVNLTGEGASLGALARAAMVAVPIAVGLYAWRHHPAEPFGRLLVAVGFGWFLTTLAESSGELLYSIGRVSAWVVEVGLIYLILAFPSGRLSTRIDRSLVWAGVTIVALLYLPTALMVDTYPVPNPYTSCDSACPANAFAVIDSEPAFVGDALIPLREALTTLLFLGVTVRLAQRVRGATPLMRLTLGPVLAVAGARALAFAAAMVVRRIAPGSQIAELMTWAIALAVPAFAAAFLLGLLQRRLHEADALERLGVAARSGLTRDALQRTLSDAIGDPGLQVVYWVDGPRSGWTDVEGRPWEASAPGSGLSLTEVREGERRVAGLVHDEALRDQVDFIHAVAAYALIALENQRLTAKVQSSLRELRESRTRIQASGDSERRRIERDLHDGAQQRLVALGIQLELTEELIKHDRDRGIAKLHSLGDEVGRTLEEIQSLARGVYPSLLADRGLAEAMRAAALRLPLAATVDSDGTGRYPADVENAVYFCCLEAMQNASKHAGAAGKITIALRERNGLVFEVRDDGVGFDRATVSLGVGLTNMHDRVASVGGFVDVTSSPGVGTVVTGRIPLDGA